ncbi:MAG TPA: methyltransferase domain-containing protein, partial [Bacteroidia bacterium]|nr:methyltransferase domain-containing protein [Bacteroidia bacterium]
MKERHYVLPLHQVNMTSENNCWFESWFDSPYYHLLYGNRDEKEAENFIEVLARFLKAPKGSRALDLACGKGRHSVALYKNGFEVTGIDLSERNI